MYRKKFSIKKFIEYRIEELKFQYRLFVTFLSMATILFGITGKSLYYDHDRLIIGIFFMYVIWHLYSYTENARTNIDSQQIINKFIELAKKVIESAGIIIIPVGLFMGIMFIHVLGYLFMTNGCEFFTIKTFIVGWCAMWGCIMIGSVCYRMTHDFMDWYGSFIDFYSETEVIEQYVE